MHTQTGTCTYETRAHTHTHSFYRCTIMTQCERKSLLLPSSRPDFSQSGLKSGLTNLALHFQSFHFFLSFFLCSFYHLHTWHSLHTHAYTHIYTHTRTHSGPSQSLSPPLSFGHPAHLWEQREHTLAWITLNHAARIAPEERCCI